MSEAELYWMRLRLDGAKLHKARRGELNFVPASGYAWDPVTSRFRFDPDEQVQRALHLVFERFRLDGSAYGVARYFARHGLTLPARDVHVLQQKTGYAPVNGLKMYYEISGSGKPAVYIHPFVSHCGLVSGLTKNRRWIGHGPPGPRTHGRHRSSDDVRTARRRHRHSLETP
jgi:hypothetical protein